MADLKPGDIVTHISDRSADCPDRDHGVVDPTVDDTATYNGSSRPEWIGVNWGRDQVRHPAANLFPCTCATDRKIGL